VWLCGGAAADMLCQVGGGSFEGPLEGPSVVGRLWTAGALVISKGHRWHVSLWWAAERGVAGAVCSRDWGAQGHTGRGGWAGVGVEGSLSCLPHILTIKAPTTGCLLALGSRFLRLTAID
jgi:hypothetical protein